MDFSLEQLAKFIDHTNLKPYATFKDIETLCDEAKKYHFKMVAVNQFQTKFCHELLKDTDIHVGAAISFPFGQTTIESKIFDVRDAIGNGADEIDYVINITALKCKDYNYIKNEMQQIVSICNEKHVISKVIFENCYLTDNEKILLSKIAKQVKPDFIKTSTGFGSGGAIVHDVKLMKDVVGVDVKVKAAGGIRSTKDFISMIEAGADRIGCSAGVSIIEKFKNQFKQDNIKRLKIDKKY
ncbi:deoxyribose-p aldolase [Liquorilactobacillus ghanensis DSM 18630]|uniref:Deoxyribose-phosphate aldolase n=1 Tax=Liquorilactobacillus ghanensis DSM 18630 TaxID=1423750 RepID=A0A0R1VIR7_9LACO|nr:deoxyribose-phosphate aldolase [Liquorilactobacillus ghanensis]KRM05712.1 deoxyribose-p aldolase [Liquorilactobacillus ghanensis DSM 18630]